MKKLSRILAISFVLLMVLASVAGAVTPYATYTYSFGGEVLTSPDAYVPDAIIDGDFMGIDPEHPISDVRDICVDFEDNITL